jgi:hypothetical protein
MILLTFKTSFNNIRSECRPANAQQPRVRLVADGKESIGQWLILGTTRPKAEACEYSCRVDGDEQTKTFKPSHTITPADIGATCQPSCATSLRISRRYSGAVQRFIGTFSSPQHHHQMQEEGLNSRLVPPQQTVELRTVRQLGEHTFQATPGVSIESSFALEVSPLTKDSQGNYLTATQRSLGAGLCFLDRLGFAKVVYHSIQYSQEGIRVDHQLAPFRWDWVAANYSPRMPFFQLRQSNSHQMFESG